MKRFKNSFVLALALVVGGCCGHERNTTTSVSVDSYVEAITKIRGNIAAIRTDVDAVTYNEDIKKADLQLIDATISLCDDTLAGKNAGAETSGQ